MLTVVWGAHTITSNGGTSVNVVEDVSYRFNISVFDTDVGVNITKMNVTIPSSFVFSAGTNATTASAGTFTNTTTVLDWANAALVGGNSTVYFFFNATAATPGSYNLTVTTANSSGVSVTNISVTVNDTTVPATIAYDNVTVANGTNLTTSADIIVNVTATDNGAISAIVVWLYGSDGTLVNSSTSATSPLYINFSGLEDDFYTFNATINDTANNINATTSRSVIVDTDGPGITLTKTASTSTSITLAVALTETNGVLNETCTSTSGTVSGSGASQTISSTGLGCGSSYGFTVTCQDSFGNTNAKTESFTTANCGGGGGGSSSGSSDSTGPKVDADLSKDATATVSARKGYVKRFVAASGDEHTMTFTEVTSDSVTLKIQSDPVVVELGVGDSKQVDLNNDGTADVKVSLESVSSGTASVMIESLAPAAPVVKPTTDVKPEDDANMPEAVPSEPSNEVMPEPSTDAGSSKTFVVVAIIIILIIVGAAAFFMRKR